MNPALDAPRNGHAMKPLLSLCIALVAFCAPGTVQAQARNEGHTLGPVVGGALHWCTFNRPCNWTGHATIALGVVYGLRKLDVAPEVAAGSAVLLFVGKEIRDHMKWGDFGSTDSIGDLAAGVLGALVGYHFFAESHEPGPVQPMVAPQTTGVSIGLRVGLRSGVSPARTAAVPMPRGEPPGE